MDGLRWIAKKVFEFAACSLAADNTIFWSHAEKLRPFQKNSARIFFAAKKPLETAAFFRRNRAGMSRSRRYSVVPTSRHSLTSNSSSGLTASLAFGSEVKSRVIKWISGRESTSLLNLNTYVIF